MSSRLGAQSPKLHAKLKILTSIRHDPAFGIAPEIMRLEFADANLTRKLLDDVPDQPVASVERKSPFAPRSPPSR